MPPPILPQRERATFQDMRGFFVQVIDDLGFTQRNGMFTGDLIHLPAKPLASVEHDPIYVFNLSVLQYEPSLARMFYIFRRNGVVNEVLRLVNTTEAKSIQDLTSWEEGVVRILESVTRTLERLTVCVPIIRTYAHDLETRTLKTG
ncbi:MAG: hypothetical protein WC477_01645 [Patescibacteria group bacterium]